ncbi:hypothetical protein H8B09_21940 [Paenibacillus sp. PR3]|uniref:Alpha/beta hydrolase n=1 Tax=Paenibacillus terricola TaxID=2763503 RepID=A0ABR8N0R1_9BACL|nr:alpha/beta hydrolase [Paenibacillus terricola]MBD3921445.1 hypothetical protein [Paenibacillus terricola]
MTENTITIPSGRTLGYAEYGRPEGAPVVMMNGTPGVRFGPMIAILDQMVKDGTAPAIRMFVLERSGYGLSDPHPGRTINDVVEDTIFFADAMELKRFAIFSGSGGAPFALACSHRYPNRVREQLFRPG